jgi:hypothetical protein
MDRQDFWALVDVNYHNALDVKGFSLMMKNPSFCYKFYWLEALVQIVNEGRTETTFDEIIDRMIVNAWYSVTQFHIHLSGFVLGDVKDGLEKTVIKLQSITDLQPNADKDQLLRALKEHAKEIRKEKTQLTNMVPFRALSGFLGPDVNWNNKEWLVSYIREFDKERKILPYVLGDSSGLEREVYISPSWTAFINDNTVAILGWISNEKLKWLQSVNPEVPGLVYKLKPLDEKIRKLSGVHKLWDRIMETGPVFDVFTGQKIDPMNYEVDHFIPWSFVMNDEVWNLSPMDPSLNSAKSNRLPKWEPFFELFARNQYMMYSLIFEDSFRKLFEDLYKYNLHSIWASAELYRPGNSEEEFRNILSANMRPVYDSARRQGYEIWNI